MATKLRVGVIGTGFGATVQIPAFRGHPRVAVVAVASGQPGKARQVADRFEVPHAFDDYEALVRADLDLVSITAPPYLHKPMAEAAFASSRHVVCEKPMALSTAEAAAMLKTAEAAGSLHLIDHELRFNPNRRKVKQLIADGFVGQPRHALVTAMNSSRLDPARPWGWWFDESRGGGLLGALGSHQVDLLRYWLGEIATVTGTVETCIAERPLADGGGRHPVTADDFTAFTLRFRSGAVATVVLSVVATHPLGPRVELWGDEGLLWIDEAERLWGARRGQAPTDLTAPETAAAPPGLEYAPLWGLSFVHLVDHVVRAALDGGPVAPAATFADGVAVQQVLDAVRQASKTDFVPIEPRAGS
jgi:predicted dehydrogenase